MNYEQITRITTNIKTVLETLIRNKVKEND